MTKRFALYRFSLLALAAGLSASFVSQQLGYHHQRGPAIAAILIPGSLTTPGEDALGNPIDPATKRVNNRATNFRDGDYGLVPDSASLDSLNALWFWAYFTGTDIVWWDFSDGAGTVKVEASGGNLVATGLTTPTFYVGDASTAVTQTTTLGSAGWKFIGLKFSDFSPSADIRYYGHQDYKLIYNESVTLADFEQSRKATKGDR